VRVAAALFDLPRISRAFATGELSCSKVRSLRRALVARNRHCCYPGCAHARRLEAHHVMHWIDGRAAPGPRMRGQLRAPFACRRMAGGKISLDNALLLCSAHQRRLHEGGYRIRSNHAGEWYFETAAGKRLCS